MTSQLSITSTPRLSTVTITPANASLKLSRPDTSIITGAIGIIDSTQTSSSPGTMHTPNPAFSALTPASPTSATTGMSGIHIPAAPAIMILLCIPPLYLRPFFPGPHPSSKLSTDSEVPHLRPPRFTKKKGGAAGHRLSVIRESVIRSDAEDVLSMDEDAEEEDTMLNHCMLIVSSLLLRTATMMKKMM